MFIPLSFGSQIPLLRAILHSLGTQNPRVQTLRVQRKTPLVMDARFELLDFGAEVIKFRALGSG